MEPITFNQLENQKLQINKVFHAYKSLYDLDERDSKFSNKRMAAGFALSLSMGLLASFTVSFFDVPQWIKLAFIFSTSYGLYTVFMAKSSLPQSHGENLIYALKTYKPLLKAEHDRLLSSLTTDDNANKEKIERWLEIENGELIKLDGSLSRNLTLINPSQKRS